MAEAVYYLDPSKDDGEQIETFDNDFEMQRTAMQADGSRVYILSSKQIDVDGQSEYVISYECVDRPGKFQGTTTTAGDNSDAGGKAIIAKIENLAQANPSYARVLVQLLDDGGAYSCHIECTAYPHNGTDAVAVQYGGSSGPYDPIVRWWVDRTNDILYFYVENNAGISEGRQFKFRYLVDAPDGDVTVYSGQPFTNTGSTIAPKLEYRTSTYVEYGNEFRKFNGGIETTRGMTVGFNLVVGGFINADGGGSTQWNAAYSWGNHALAGYITSESDTLGSVTSRGNSTTNNVLLGGRTDLGNSASQQMRVGYGVSSLFYEPYIDFYNNTTRRGYIQAKNEGNLRIYADQELHLSASSAIKFYPYDSTSDRFTMVYDGGEAYFYSFGSAYQRLTLGGVNKPDGSMTLSTDNGTIYTRGLLNHSGDMDVGSGHMRVVNYSGQQYSLGVRGEWTYAYTYSLRPHATGDRTWEFTSGSGSTIGVQFRNIGGGSHVLTNYGRIDANNDANNDHVMRIGYGDTSSNGYLFASWYYGTSRKGYVMAHGGDNTLRIWADNRLQLMTGSTASDAIYLQDNTTIDGNLTAKSMNTVSGHNVSSGTDVLNYSSNECYLAIVWGYLDRASQTTSIIVTDNSSNVWSHVIDSSSTSFYARATGGVIDVIGSGNVSYTILRLK